MHPRLTHVRLLVQDYQACFRFYRDVMGFDVAWGDEDGRYADFSAGDAMVALYRRELMAEAVGTAALPGDADVQDRALLNFAVDDVDAACEQLKARGVEFVTEPQDRPDWGIRTAHFRDPDGNLIEIYRDLPAT
ncbi:MAG: extradiol dioxygenase [Chloroflexi bacterium RBG_16_68_14]|nr:MAG: extradiol dioxygenase [Chloroflexi bacterium RBG_16_68_14]